MQSIDIDFIKELETLEEKDRESWKRIVGSVKRCPDYALYVYFNTNWIT
jgi:hypothetical protein